MEIYYIIGKNVDNFRGGGTIVGNKQKRYQRFITNLKYYMQPTPFIIRYISEGKE